MSIMRTETVIANIEYRLELQDDGYQVLREGEPWDFISWDLIRIFVDEQTLLESYLAGEFNGSTGRMVVWS